METLLTTALEREIEAAQGETISLLKALCAIPAPSHHEERRAEWIQAWLEKRGLSAEIDDAKNVRCGFGLSQYQDIVVIMAHIDTVFPDLQPMPMREEAGRLDRPGVGDDTANVAGMLTLMDIFHRLNARPACGVLFVCNSWRRRAGQSGGMQSHYAAILRRASRHFFRRMINRHMSAPVPSVPRGTGLRRKRARPQLCGFRSAQRRRGAQPPGLRAVSPACAAGRGQF